MSHLVSPRRGKLRVLLGAAPGVGKTYAMLAEGHRRAQRGTDVVVGFVETHGREQTAAQLVGLEVVPRKTIEHRGARFTEMDVDAVLKRRPEVALVDELAHTNVPGSRNPRRTDDVEDLLAAGIDVITTVNVQHLESLNDVVEQITGVKQRETVPDAVVRAADQIELVDMAPEALRRRMEHGNVYSVEKVPAALSNYFRVGNLTALRELALLWVADRVDAGLTAYRSERSISDTWATRERVVVALSGGPEGESLLRRGARITHRGVGGELLAVYVARSDGLVASDRAGLAKQRALVEDLSGTFHTLTGEDPAEVILDYARKVNATSIVVGTTRSSRWQRIFREPMDRRIVNGSGDIDVHLVSHQWQGSGVHRRPEELSWGRRIAGWVTAIAAPVALTAMLNLWHHVNESFSLMAFLALTVAIALIGGLGPALVAAVLGSLLVNWFFTPPVRTLTIYDPKSLAALVIFGVVGAAVALVVDRAARRARQANQARAEADTLFLLTEQTLASDLTTERALALLRETFQQAGVELRRRDTVTSPWQRVGIAGEAHGSPDTIIPITDHLQFACYGDALTPPNERVMTAFGHQFQARRERDELRAQAQQVNELEARDSLQTALLAAVSHDLRTPLSAIKAGTSSLLADDVDWSPEARHSLLEIVDDNADRLEHLIANLLDLTRLRTGHLAVDCKPVMAEELLRFAVSDTDASSVTVELPADLPLISTDPGLGERILANLIDNARRHQPSGMPVRVSGHETDDAVIVSVVDNGPGVPRERREQMFKPFQRLGDAPGGSGIGLGLAVASGFASALGATLTPSDTPGGGLTMSVAFPKAETL